MKTVVTILSANYSGSHFLSLLLGSHSRMMHVGEVKHMRKAADSRKRLLCHLCDPISICPLYRGVTPQNIGRVYEIIFRNVSRLYPDVGTMIDTSKKVSWAEPFVGRTPYAHKYLHLVRDPRALARRWMMTHSSAKQRWHVRWKTFRGLVKQRPQVLFEPRSQLHLYRWLIENREITHFLRSNDLDHRILTYQDLALRTEDSLRQLVSWLGLEFEPEQLEYWNFEHHGTQKPNYEWIKREKRVGYFDTRWKEYLTANQARRIVENRDFAAYINELNLELDDSGLTQKSRPGEHKATGDDRQFLPEAA